MPNEMEDLLARVRPHEAAGYAHSHAFELAAFEARIDRTWPAGWGKDLGALVFGDFTPPTEQLTYRTLGITIDPENHKGTVVKSEMTVLLARVTIADKSLASIKDAARRLNLLVGLLSDSHQGAPIRWSYVTSPTAGDLRYGITDSDSEVLLAIIDLLPPSIRNNVEAALYWLREPRSMVLEQQARADQLPVYAGYWNAFECLVEGVNTLVPMRRMTRAEKNAAITARLAAANGVLDAALVDEMYRGIVDRGLRERAAHAIRLCAGATAADFIREAFAYTPPQHGLYSVRNAINHGTVNVHDPETVMLVDSRFSSLFMLVRIMLNGLLRINAERVAAAAAARAG